MIGLIVAEASLFAVFVVAYLYDLGKSPSGPSPGEVLSVPLLGTVCLLSSSVTVAMAVRALGRGAVWAVSVRPADSCLVLEPHADSAPYRSTPPRLPHVAVHVGLGRPRLIAGDLTLYAQTLILRVLLGPAHVEALARTGIGIGVDDLSSLMRLTSR
jgi:hypothetical protein